jgi:hypothetical protein
LLLLLLLLLLLFFNCSANWLPSWSLQLLLLHSSPFMTSVLTHIWTH